MEGYTFESTNGIEVLKLQGSILAAASNNEILEEISQRINAGKKWFVIDLADSKFVNSTGLSLLISALTKSRQAGGEVVLANIAPELEKLLVMTKLNSIFTSSKDVAAAMAVIEASKADHA